MAAGSGPSAAALARENLELPDGRVEVTVDARERLARDLYQLFADTYDQARPFSNIVKSEQRHFDAVGTLLLDDRLGDPQLVDAVAQDLDVLLDRAVLDALLRLGLELRQHARVDPDWVRAYVDSRGDHLSGLSRREALKHL